MNQQLAIQKIDDEAFGNLIQMPGIYNEGLERVTNAKTYTDSLLSPLDGININEVDGIEMEALMVPIRDCRVFVAEAIEEMNGKRSPHTKKMDAIKSLSPTWRMI
jgi:hypothetical protein